MIRYLIQKEFLQIRRNAFLPRLIIIFPIVIMCVMPVGDADGGEEYRGGCG